MVLRVMVAMASEAVAMPTTKVGKPACAARVTAASAPGESSAEVLLLPGWQLGRPSVARSRNFGFESVSVCMYAVALSSAVSVGVLPPVEVLENDIWMAE